MNETEKKNAKSQLNLTSNYTVDEILDALLLNDLSALDKMRSRLMQLKSAYDLFEKEIDSGDKERINIAISSFKRPSI